MSAAPAQEARAPDPGWRPFPASGSQLLVPVADRRSARAGMAMYAPCMARSVVVRDALWWGVRVAGAGLLRSPGAGWPLPVDGAVWEALRGTLRAAVPPWDAIAVYRRPADRPGATVALIADGRQVGIVRLEPEREAGIAREVAALRLVAAHGPSTFVVPQVRATGTCAGWAWALLAPLALGRHRMAVGPVVARVADEVAVALAALDRPSGTPAHWRPAHGDFVPWNLRTLRRGGRGRSGEEAPGGGAGRSRGGRPALLDWESVCWAPPGTDLALYDVSARAVGRRAGVTVPPDDEVVAHLRDAVARRLATAARRGQPPDPLNRRILGLLGPCARSGAW